MRVDQIYPNTYLSASDIGNHKLQAVICEVGLVVLDGEQKLALSFEGKQKLMVLNRSNASAMAEVFGQETDGWLGKSVELYTIRTEFKGRPVDGLRLRPLPPEQPQAEEAFSTF